MEGCGMNCIKYLLFAFNLLFLFCGVGLIVAGSLVLAHINYPIVVGTGPAITLIVLGIIVVIICFLGCCGAIKEHNGMLMAFAVILILIFIAQIAVVITAAVFKDTINENMKSSLNKYMEQYSSGGPEIQDTWDSLQQDFRCCGVNDYGDWAGARHQYPASCCADPDKNEPYKGQYCQQQVPKFTEGCYSKLLEEFKKGQDVIIGVGIAFGLLEVAGAILACFLAKTIRKESSETA